MVALTSYENPTSQEERSEQFAKAEEFVRDYALSFPTAITDDDSIYRGYMVRSLPSAGLAQDSPKRSSVSSSASPARLTCVAWKQAHRSQL